MHSERHGLGLCGHFILGLLNQHSRADMGRSMQRPYPVLLTARRDAVA
jgi:hypothetical protein